MEVKRNRVINKGSLQKGRPQTHHKNPCYVPHMIIRAAKKDMNNPDSGYEPGFKLREYMAEEEKAINNKFRVA